MFTRLAGVIITKLLAVQLAMALMNIKQCIVLLHVVAVYGLHNIDNYQSIDFI